MNPAIATTIHCYTIIGGAKYPTTTVIQAEDADSYEKLASDFFSTLAAKVDEGGDDLFVTFEPRDFAASRPAGPGAPLPDAPKNVPSCPIHNVALKEKTNRSTGAKFFSCGERNANGGYCNWKPADQR